MPRAPIEKRNWRSAARAGATILCPRRSNCLPIVLTVIVTLAFTSYHVTPATAAPFQATDSFKPACGGLLSEPPPKGWKLWSDWRTWGARAKAEGVPGRGTNLWRNVTVPCGTAVLLDVPSISVGALTIKGWLKVRDHSSLPSININAHFVIVQGKLSAGSPSKHFSQRLTVTLHPNSRGDRRPYLLTDLAPADSANPRDLGHKAFAVVGGQLSLHGMPGGSSTPSWGRLAQTANRGQRHIVVDANVAAWRKGWSVGIASTSTDLNDAEHHEIVSVSATTGGTRITLKSPLASQHESTLIPDGFGGSVHIRAEVALLDRHISIRGTSESGANAYDGGHFMVYMTKTPQFIEGVQFNGMGNQGVLGKYPVHFHVCGSGAAHVVRKNAIVFSRQRCLVVHATTDMTIEDNVTYETKGHCFLLEEGAEMQNVFRRNLGINVRKVSKVIPSATTNRLDFHTDKQPSTFWLATPFSSFYDNVAAGSEDSGFWLEANPYMRGLSRLLPIVGAQKPFYHKWGTYSGNVIHSAKFGFRTYPHGTRPRYTSTTANTRVTLHNHLIYRNKFGIFLFNSERLSVLSCSFVENAVGIDISRNAGVTAKGCRFIGRAANAGCKLRPKSSSPLRSASPLSSPPVRGPTTAWDVPSLTESLGPLDPYAQDGGEGADDLGAGSGGNGTDPNDEAGGGSDAGFGGNGTDPSTGSDGGSGGGVTGDSGGDGSDSSDGGGGNSGSNSTVVTDSNGIPVANSSSSSNATISNGTTSANSSSSSSSSSQAPVNAIATISSASSLLLPPSWLSTLSSLSSLLSSSPSTPDSVQSTNDQRASVQSTNGDDGFDSGDLDDATDDNAFGSFASPMGITMSQSNPQDNLYPNSIQDSKFSGFGSCGGSSFSLVLVANKAGGYWNSAMFVKGLKFAKGTNRIWATPNPRTGTPPRGGLLANMYALRDLDGSLLGQSGFAVAPFTPILPPASVRSKRCSMRNAYSVYACTGVCYRSVGLAYEEWGVRSKGMGGLPAKVLRPHSYATITRVEDGSQFVAYGTDNDNPTSKPADGNKKMRYITVSLLSGYTYRVTITPAETNALFYPPKLKLVLYDRGGCTGGLRVVLEAPSGKRWNSNAPVIPCSSRDPSRTYHHFECTKGQQRLALDIGATASGTVAVATLGAAPSKTCSAKTACSRASSLLPRIRSSPLNKLGAGGFYRDDPFFDASFYGSSVPTLDPSAISGSDLSSNSSSSSTGNSSTIAPGNQNYVAVSSIQTSLLPVQSQSVRIKRTNHEWLGYAGRDSGRKERR